MKKKLFKTRLLSFAAFCGLTLVFASCVNEDVAQGTTGTDNENDKNLTTFVAGDEAKTRTSMDYTSGNFYWEAGDYIYVKDDNNIWRKSSNSPTGKVASFKFKVPGKFTASTNYKVYYPGKNGSNDQVTIPATQTQATPNTTAHFGESGDCGTANATGTIGGGLFSFALDHQAAILVFQPYTGNVALNNCYLTKIEVTSDNNITGTYTFNPTTGELTGSGTDKEINIITTGSGAYTNGFSLTGATSASTADKIYMHIKPGTHTLRVRYWIKSLVDNVEGTITKELSSFTYNKNTYYDMTANLDVRDYAGLYYQWDAQENTWYQHEWNATNPADRWQPTVNNGVNSNINLLTKTVCPQRWPNISFPGAGVQNDAINSCKNCPNANEALWYAEYGDSRWDNDELWTTMGHLHKGGIWLKKKDRIARDNGKSITDLANAAPDGTDYRSSNALQGIIYKRTGVPSTLPDISEKSDYFYLPLTGHVPSLTGKMWGLGSFGGYWTSTAHPYLHNTTGGASAFVFFFTGNEVWVDSTPSREGNSFKAQIFE